MGVGGFRLDAAKHIAATDLTSIFRMVHGSPFIVSETYIGVGEPVSIDEYEGLGHVNFFRYAYDIGGAFNSATTSALPTLFKDYVDSNLSVIFLENHDLQRTDSTTLVSLKATPAAYRLATVFMLTWPYGYPQVFSGYDFKDYNQGPPVDAKGFTLPIMDSSGNCKAPWLCEHRLQGVSELVRFRNFTDSAFHADGVWTGGEGQIAFSRGNLGFVAINASKNGRLNATIPSGLRNGCYCNIIDSNFRARAQTCAQGITVRSGYANIQLPAQSALVLRSDVKCPQQPLYH
jgi:alpha-amylase